MHITFPNGPHFLEEQCNGSRYINRVLSAPNLYDLGQSFIFWEESSPPFYEDEVVLEV